MGSDYVGLDALVVVKLEFGHAVHTGKSELSLATGYGIETSTIRKNRWWSGELAVAGGAIAFWRLLETVPLVEARDWECEVGAHGEIGLGDLELVSGHVKNVGYWRDVKNKFVNNVFRSLFGENGEKFGIFDWGVLDKSLIVQKVVDLVILNRQWINSNKSLELWIFLVIKLIRALDFLSFSPGTHEL